MHSSTLLRWDKPEQQYTDSAESSQAKEHVMLVASKREEIFGHVRGKLNKVTRTEMGQPKSIIEADLTVW